MSDVIRLNLPDCVIAFRDENGYTWIRAEAEGDSRKRKRVGQAGVLRLIDGTGEMDGQCSGDIQELMEMTREIRSDVKALSLRLEGEGNRVITEDELVKGYVDRLRTSDITGDSWLAAWKSIQPHLRRLSTKYNSLTDMPILQSFNPPTLRHMRPVQIITQSELSIKEIESERFYTFFAGTDIPLCPILKSLLDVENTLSDQSVQDLLSVVYSTYLQYQVISTRATPALGAAGSTPSSLPKFQHPIVLIPNITHHIPTPPPIGLPTAQQLNPDDSMAISEAWNVVPSSWFGPSFKIADLVNAPNNNNPSPLSLTTSLSLTSLPAPSSAAILGWLRIHDGLVSYVIYLDEKVVRVYDPLRVWTSEAVEWLFKEAIQMTVEEDGIEQWHFEASEGFTTNPNLPMTCHPAIIVSLIHNHMHALIQRNNLPTPSNPIPIAPTQTPLNPILPIQTLDETNAKKIRLSYLLEMTNMALEWYEQLYTRVGAIGL